jgi:hypothetical protein
MEVVFIPDAAPENARKAEYRLSARPLEPRVDWLYPNLADKLRILTTIPIAHTQNLFLSYQGSTRDFGSHIDNHHCFDAPTAFDLMGSITDLALW